MRVSLPLATAALLASLAPLPAPAQAPPDADTREVLAYRLTMPKLRQLNQVFLDLHRQQEADPAYQQLQKKKTELAALAEKEDPTEAELERMARLEEEIAELEEAEEGDDVQDESLSAMAARMEADPRVAGALKRGGLGAREAATMMLALFQAGLTAELLESGTVKEMPKDVNAENVRFYQANRAAIAALEGLADRERE